MRDDVRAGDDAPDRGRIPDVGFSEISPTRPAFRSMTGDPGDGVALAEQSDNQAAAKYSAGPGDRDPH